MKPSYAAAAAAAAADADAISGLGHLALAFST